MDPAILDPLDPDLNTSCGPSPNLTLPVMGGFQTHISSALRGAKTKFLDFFVNRHIRNKIF